MADLVIALERWFAGSCDGDWEHGRGVRINTLDNPGWSVDIELAGTSLSGKAFAPVREERAEHDWMHCWTDAEVFRGRGGPRNLREILALFLSWSGADTEKGA
jgi:hypothetical protein